MSEENEEFKSACSTLYEKHKDLFDFIIKNIELGGSVNEAIKNFIKEASDSIKVNGFTNRWFSFIPEELYKIMPDVVLTRPWHKLNKKPIVFFYSFYDDKVKLVVEVGPIENLDIRNKLVTALFKCLKNINRVAKSDTYTRVWSKVEKYDSNQDVEDVGAEKLLKHMNNLSKQVDKLTPQIKEAISETFQLDVL